MGYDAVQISGVGPIPEEEIVKILDGEGLVCCATHEPGNVVLETPEMVVERLSKLGCKYTAYPFPGGVDMGSEESVDTMIRGLDKAGAVLKDNGQVLTYHNHNHELRKLAGQTVLDRIYNNTNPQNLQAEIDTHWIQAGGGNPITWCEKLEGRLPLLHLKDFAMADDNSKVFGEIGNGNLEWKTIIEAAEKSGCEWFIVEQDGAWLNGDPFQSAKASVDYILGNLVD